MYTVILKRLLLVIFFVSSQAYFEREDNVAILTEKNKEKVLKNFPNIFFYFYTPWCTVCKRFISEYSYFANRVLDENLKILPVKIDCEKYPKLAKEFNVTSYPTLFMYVNKTRVDYGGNGNKDHLYSWSLGKLNSIFKEVSVMEEFIDFLNRFRLMVFFAASNEGGQSSRLKDLRRLNLEFDQMPFLYTSNRTILKLLDLKEDSLYYFRRFENMRQLYQGEWEIPQIIDFIVDHSFPKIALNPHLELKPYVAKTFYLFVNTTGVDHFKGLYRLLESVADNYHQQINFLLLDVKDKGAKTFVEFLNAKEGQYRITDKTQHRVLRYKPQRSILTLEKMTEFIEDFLQGRLEAIYRTEREPEDWNENPVATLVAETFPLRAEDEKTAIFILFYLPNMEANFKLFSLLDELGRVYESRGDVIIAKINARDNELKTLQPTAFPCIFFRGKGKREFVEYDASLHLKSLQTFIEHNGAKKERFHIPTEEELDREEL